MIELSTWETLIYTLLIISLMVVLSKLLSEVPPAVRIRDNKNGHKWSYTDFVINFPLHCNACETFLLTSKGQCCTVCGVKLLEKNISFLKHCFFAGCFMLDSQMYQKC